MLKHFLLLFSGKKIWAALPANVVTVDLLWNVHWRTYSLLETKKAIYKVLRENLVIFYKVALGL